MLIKRVLTAAILAPLVIALIVAGPGWGFPLLVLLVIPLALWEFTNMSPLKGNLLESRSLLVVGTLAGAGMIFLAPHTLQAVPASLAVATIAMLVVHLVRPGSVEAAGGRTMASLAGLLYGAFLPAHFAWLYQLGHDGMGWKWVLTVLVLTWVGDSFAYFFGRSLGKHKLYPLVSPKKSWEGAVAGVVGSVLAVWIIRITFFPELFGLDVLAIGIPAAVLGQIGDFSESLFKRSAGVKDSSGLFPGHGGILDRLDALLFAVPYVYYYAIWVYPVSG